jgi:hypothetical protein
LLFERAAHARGAFGASGRILGAAFRRMEIVAEPRRLSLRFRDLGPSRSLVGAGARQPQHIERSLVERHD